MGFKPSLRGRKHFRLFLRVLFIVILSGGAFLYGQESDSIPGLLQPFDNTGGSARAMAMGSAFVGVADDASALLWNPAGLAKLGESQIALHHDSWLVGTLQESLLVGLPMGNLGGFGAMVSYMDYGTFQGRDSSGNPTSDYTADNAGLMLGWGKELDPGFSVGLAIQGYDQGALNHSYGILSGDLGLLFTSGPNLRFGVAWVNFGGYQADALVASTIRAGFSIRRNFGKSNSLLLALAANFELQGVDDYQVGVEYAFQSRYFLRAGYQYSGQNNGIEGLSGLTAGAGVRLGDFQLDYAYLPYGDLGTSNRVSLSYFFPAPREKPDASKTSPRPDTVEEPAGSFKPNDGSQTSRKVLTLQFDVPPADLVSQGRVLDGQGKLGEAMKLYEDELRQNGRDGAAWYYLGADYDKLGQKTNAIQCFQQVLKLNPDDKTLADWLDRYELKP